MSAANSQFKPLALLRNPETDRIYPTSIPFGWYFHEIAYGFQIMDQSIGTPKDDEPFYHGELAYTVLISSGQHLRSEIMIIHSGVDGDMKMLQKGSISFEDGQDLRWIESILNKHWEPQKPKGAVNTEAYTAFARENPKQALAILANILGNS
jgi:hypothetical protein